MQATSLGEYDYICGSERKKKKSEKTVYRLATLTFAQDRWLENQIDKGCPEGDAIYHLLNMGLRGVTNLKKGKGEVKAERDEDSGDEYIGELKPWSDEFLSQIPKLHRTELALKIKFGNEITEAERKN